MDLFGRGAGIQWVQEVADAGGKSYTFHLEALKDPGLSFYFCVIPNKKEVLIKISFSDSLY